MVVVVLDDQSEEYAGKVLSSHHSVDPARTSERRFHARVLGGRVRTAIYRVHVRVRNGEMLRWEHVSDKIT